MAALRLAGLVRNRGPEDRDAGSARRRRRTRTSGVEALKRRRLLSVTAVPPINEFAVPTPSAGPVGIATGPDGAIWFTEYNSNQIGRLAQAIAMPRLGRIEAPDAPA
jgi:streptogramin lyase